MINPKSFNIIWVGIILFLLTLLVLSSDSGKRQSWNPIEKIIIEITAPFQNFFKKTVKSTENVWLKYFDLINVRNENIDLKRKNDLLKMENDRFRELLSATKRLQQLTVDLNLSDHSITVAGSGEREFVTYGRDNIALTWSL